MDAVLQFVRDTVGSAVATNVLLALVVVELRGTRPMLRALIEHFRIPVRRRAITEPGD